ncbi:MAG TPA: hypothetical protein VFD43_12585, partial [Planctomycetota bacterium]|nr:hypothetical protein [Planctomycetota bacterium]
MNENNKSGGQGGWEERGAEGATGDAAGGAGEQPLSDEALVTAYALGELDGAESAAQRAHVEVLMAGDAAVAEEVERIRELAKHPRSRACRRAAAAAGRREPRRSARHW